METFAKSLLFLPIASFALAAGALVVRIRQQEKGARAQFVTASLIFILLSSTATGFIILGERSRTRMLADEVVSALGNEKKTYEEMLVGLKNPDRASLSAAIELLDTEGRVGTEVTFVTNKADDKIFRVRTYYVRTFNR